MSTNRQSRVQVAPVRDEAPVPSRGSWIPLVFSLLAGLVVIGLLGTIMLSPAKPAAPVGAAPGGATNPGALVEALRIGALAPDFTLAGMNGGQTKLSSYRGNKAVWVNFWATWCTFCKQEMPEMQKLYPTYKDRVEFLGVDDHESQAAVQQYVGLGGYNWNFVLDPDGAVDAKYQIQGLPTHIFIGRDGVIKDLVVGGIQQDRMVSELASLVAP